jgi:acyl carrier protein
VHGPAAPRRARRVRDWSRGFVSEIRARAVEAISGIVSCTAEELERADRFTELGNWDSLMHLKVVLALEEEFGVQFALADVLQLQSLTRAVELVERKALR